MANRGRAQFAYRYDRGRQSSSENEQLRGRAQFAYRYDRGRQSSENEQKLDTQLSEQGVSKLTGFQLCQG